MSERMVYRQSAMTPKTLKRIKEIAEQKEWSINQVIREAIKKGLELI